MPVTCEYCLHTFSSQPSLNVHLRRAKYCLEKRGKQTQYMCDTCDRQFAEKRSLEGHRRKCNLTVLNETLNSEAMQQKKIIAELTTIMKERENNSREREELLKAQIRDLSAQVRDLSARLENVAIKGVTKSTNTNIIKMECLTPEHLQDCAKLLGPKDVANASTLAKFAVDNSFKNRVVATDRTRKTLSWKDTDGVVRKDRRGKTLANKFFESIRDKDAVVEAVHKQIYTELDSLGNDIPDDEREGILNRMSEIIKIQKGIKKISAGEEHEIREEFVAKLCEYLP